MQESSERDFAESLFGVFNDSLPDSWGRLLLDRSLIYSGINPNLLSPLDRLSCAGNRTLGALIYEPMQEIVSEKKSKEELNLKKLLKESKKVLEGSSEEVIQELLSLNGSSGGARPKILAALSKDRKSIIHDASRISPDYEHWMIKFPSRYDLEDIAEIEYAYSLMARKAGLEIPDTHLFHLEKGVHCFGIKRFDRNRGKRIHMHSLSGLLHSNHTYYNLDYESFLKVTLSLTKDQKELLKAFRLMVFNILAHNRDDHSKNFSFLMSENGSWSLSPAYDLTFSYGPRGEHSMTVLGEGLSPKLDHIRGMANKFRINEWRNIYDEVQDAIQEWKHFAKEADLSKASSKMISEKLQC